MGNSLFGQQAYGDALVGRNSSVLSGYRMKTYAIRVYFQDMLAVPVLTNDRYIYGGRLGGTTLDSIYILSLPVFACLHMPVESDFRSHHACVVARVLHCIGITCENGIFLFLVIHDQHTISMCRHKEVIAVWQPPDRHYR